MATTESRELLSLYEERLITLFGPETAQKIILLLVEIAEGARISVPSLSHLEAEARNKKIRILFNGQNYSNLAADFDLSVRHIRRIVNRS